jgi:hypothetical protein
MKISVRKTIFDKTNPYFQGIPGEFLISSVSYLSSIFGEDSAEKAVSESICSYLILILFPGWNS